MLYMLTSKTGKVIINTAIKSNGVIGLKSHSKKMVAPIVISVIVILYYIVYFCFLILLLDGIWKYLLGIIPIALSAVMIAVCVERINEIKKGEEDDIGKY